MRSVCYEATTATCRLCKAKVEAERPLRGLSLVRTERQRGLGAGCRGGSERGSDSRSLLKVVPWGLVDGFAVGYETKEGDKDDSKDFGPSH